MTERQIQKQGRLAEQEVSLVLHNLGVEYHVFDDVMLKTRSGSTQIDHVVISPYGVFVIETKSHKGMIFGDCNSQNWTQVLFDKTGQKNHQFYSPYKQNFGHLRNLYKHLNLDYSCFLGIIVFTNGDVNLSRLQCPNAIYGQYLSSVILSHRDILLSDFQVCTACNILNSINIQSPYMARKHKSYVKAMGRG